MRCRTSPSTSMQPGLIGTRYCRFAIRLCERRLVNTLVLFGSNWGRRFRKKVRPAPGGERAARDLGLGTGRGGDVTEAADLLSDRTDQRDVAGAGCRGGSPRALPRVRARRDRRV